MQALLDKIHIVSIIATNQVQYDTLNLEFDVHIVEVNQDTP